MSERGVSSFWTHVLMALVCLQATFLIPYLIIVPGERTNIFTSLLTLLPLLHVGLVCVGSDRIAWKPVLLWSLLAMGITVSALASLAPASSLWRALSFLAPAASGFAYGSMMISTNKLKDFLFNLLTACFAGLVLTHLVWGAQPSFLGLHHHALAGVLVLLAAGPIRLLWAPRLLWRVIAYLLLFAGSVVCFLAGSRFVILLPFVMIPIYLYLRRISLNTAVCLLAVGAIVAGAFFVVFPSKILRVENYESTYYRVEAFPATWEIVKQHPLLGVGIRTPREVFLKSYKPVSGMTKPEEFFGTLERNVTWDNQYLSLLCGIGAPLTVLYFGMVGSALVQYLRSIRIFRTDSATERALTFPLLASTIHFAVHDGLFYPQISWFFHLLLGVGVALVLPTATARIDDERGSAASSFPGGQG